MPPKTRSNVKSTRTRSVTNGGSISTTTTIDTKKTVTMEGKKTNDCLLLTTNGYKPDQGRTMKFRCPQTGNEESYIIDQAQELVWQIVQYRHEEFASVLTPMEILPSTDPFYLLAPVNPISIILPYLVKEEDRKSTNVSSQKTNASNGCSYEDPRVKVFETFGAWNCVRNTLKSIGEFSGDESDLKNFRVDHSKLGKWIEKKAHLVYEKVKTGRKALDDQYCREFAIKTVRQQLPAELRDLVRL